MNYHGILRRKNDTEIQWIVTDKTGKVLDSGCGRGDGMDALADAYHGMRQCFLRYGDGDADFEIDLRTDEERNEAGKRKDH